MRKMMFGWRLLAMGVVVVGLAFFWIGTADAADDVNSYVAVTGVQKLSHPGNFTDHSGVALTPQGSLLVVDNDEDSILEYWPTPQGWALGRIFELNEASNNIDDLEDITWMGNNRYGLIDESDNRLSVILIPSAGTAVTELYSTDLRQWVPRFENNGIEGLAYSFDESVPGIDTFYIASERNALLVRIDLDSGNGSFRAKGPDIALGVRTLAAVHDVDGDDTFYVVSNEARAMYRFDKSGVQLGPARPLDLQIPEGLTMTPDLTRMIVVGEAGGGNEIQEFEAGDTPSSRTSFSQVSSQDDDAIESNGTVTTTGALLLGSEGSQYAGLRFTDMCIPKNANITSAHLGFVATAFDGSESSLTVRGVRGADGGPFSSGPGSDISGRLATARSVSSNITAWGSPFREYLPGLAPVISELIGQSDRGECDPITLQITGSGLRRAFSHDLGAAQAPSLVIDWAEGATPLPFGVSVTTSCLAGLGRVDITVSNPIVVAEVATVSLSGLPLRTLLVPATGEATTTFTGRSNGRYLVEVGSNGATNANELVVTSCEQDVSVQTACVSENGLFRVRMRNPQSASTTFAVTIGELLPRFVTVQGQDTGMVGVSGRADGDYLISVTSTVDGSGETALVYEESSSVSCDPPPPAGEVDVVISCLSGNGLVSIVLYNSTSETEDYTVRFGALPERVRELESGRVKKLAISGRPDGLHQLTVLRGDVAVRDVSVFIACD